MIMTLRRLLISSALVVAVSAQSASSSSTTSARAAAITALDDCHLHGLVQYAPPSIPPILTPPFGRLAGAVLTGPHRYCVPQLSGAEVAVTTASNSAAASALPTVYTGCYSHDGEFFCAGPVGTPQPIDLLSSPAVSGHTGDSGADDDHAAGENCHFHAGIEHCTAHAAGEADAAGEAEAAGPGSDACARRDRSYNVPRRVGAIFVVLSTSAIAVFLPLLLRRFARLAPASIAFTAIKQFGAGVIIATAFIHLLTHAGLMFTNSCVGPLAYEAATTAVAMAGLFAAAAVEYAGHRFIAHRADMCHRRRPASPSPLEDGSSSVVSKEQPRPGTAAAAAVANGAADSAGAGVGAGAAAAAGGAVDGAAATGLAMVPPAGCHPSANDRLSVLVMEMGIIFHSILIGITLVVAGDSVFATLLVVIVFHQAFEGLALGARISALAPASSLDSTKITLAALFSAITPVGMAIGIGVRHHFNGNDRTTLLALGTLDALSAGILVWVGLVEMLACDWLYGDLRRASALRTTVAAASLIGGTMLMGLLGKWA